MERTEIEAIVVSVLRTVLDTDVDTETSRETTAQWDSLKHIQVIFGVEDALKVEFSELEMQEIRSVRDIVNAVAAHHAA